MSDDQAQLHDDCMQRFIDLANTMKDERVPVSVVSWALMTASGIYATYSVTGNSGGLNPSGIDKVTDAYKQNLSNIQEMRKSQEATGGAKGGAKGGAQATDAGAVAPTGSAR
ncbi:MAG: DUF3144 domain-containing protein [Congregibacter sp.]